MSDATASAGFDVPGRHLDEFLINVSVNEPFDAASFGRCLGKKSLVADETHGVWLNQCRVSEPAGLARVIIQQHDVKANLHYHVLIFFNSTEQSPDVTSLTWNDVIRRFGSAHPAEIDCRCSARAKFPRQNWTTVLGIPKAAGGLVPGVYDGTVMLSGLNLDFSQTSLPFDSLSISATEEWIQVEVHFARRLDLQTVSGVKLLDEATEISRLFVIESSEVTDVKSK